MDEDDTYPQLTWRDPQPNEKHKEMAQRLVEHWWDESGKVKYAAAAELEARRQLDELLYGFSVEKRTWRVL